MTVLLCDWEYLFSENGTGMQYPLGPRSSVDPWIFLSTFLFLVTEIFPCFIIETAMVSLRRLKTFFPLLFFIWLCFLWKMEITLFTNCCRWPWKLSGMLGPLGWSNQAKGRFISHVLLRHLMSFPSFCWEPSPTFMFIWSCSQGSPDHLRHPKS